MTPAPAPLPREEIERLEKLLEKATHGEHAADTDLPVNRHPRVHAGGRLVAVFGNMETGEESRWEADAALFAKLRNAAPALIDLEHKYRAALDRIIDLEILLGETGHDLEQLRAEIEAGRAGAERVRPHEAAYAAQSQLVLGQQATIERLQKELATLRQAAQPAPDMIQQHEKQLADWVYAHPVFGSAHGAYMAPKAAQPADGAQAVTEAQYLAAVTGRSDFRNAYRRALVVVKYARVLRDKWRTAGQKIDSDDFIGAVADTCDAADQFDFGSGKIEDASDTTPAAPAQVGAQPAGRGEPFTFLYLNYKGEIGERRAVPMSVRFGSTEWHPEPQWLLRAFDVEKQAEREFAMKDMLVAPPATPPTAGAGEGEGA